MDILEIEYPYLEPCTELFLEVFNEAPWNQKWDEKTAKARLTETFLSSRFQGLMLAENDFLRAFVMGYMETWEDQAHFRIKEFCIQTDQMKSKVPSTLIKGLKKHLKKQDVSVIHCSIFKNKSISNILLQSDFTEVKDDRNLICKF